MNYQAGDKVRVAFGATVSDSKTRCVCTAGGEWPLEFSREYLDNIERAGGTVSYFPAPFFPPGTTIQHKKNGQKYLVLENGSVLLPAGPYIPGDHKFYSNNWVGVDGTEVQQKVNVVLDTVVVDSWGDCFCSQEIEGLRETTLEFIEKGGTVKAQPERFGAGTFVKSKTSGMEYLVCDSGYVTMPRGRYIKSNNPFTSNSYDKLEGRIA